MNLSQITEALEMRAVLESHLLRKAARRFDKVQIDRLRAICEETDKIKDYGSHWVVKNWEFHRALYGRSDSPAIVEAVERIQLNVERYARRAGSAARLRQAAAEHWQILNAVERNDFTKASALLEAHILHTGKVIGRDYDKLAARSAGKSPVKKQKRPATQK
jgi:DNA-binding GntR family transcriptional regulator